MRMAYPFLPIFPRIRGIVLLDEDRNIFYASPKRKTMQELMPGLLHAASGISGIINEEVQEITTGKLRIHIVKEEKPFPFFTAVVVNKEASNQVGLWAIYLSKFVSTLLLESKVSRLTDECKEIIKNNLSDEIDAIKVPKRKDVLNFAVQVLHSLEKCEGLRRDVEDVHVQQSQKEEKEAKIRDKKDYDTESASLKKIYHYIDQGKIAKAFLLSERQRENAKFALFWLALGLILKEMHYKMSAPSMKELEKMVETFDGEKYSSLLQAIDDVIQLKKRAQGGVQTYRYVRQKIERLFSRVQPLSNKFKRYLVFLILHSIISVFLPVKQDVLNFLSKFTTLSNAVPFSLFWDGSHNEKTKNVARSVLPTLLVRTFTWKNFQPFSYILLKLRGFAKNTTGSVHCNAKTRKAFSLYRVYVNALRSFISFFALGIFFSPRLTLSEKETVLTIFKEELDSVLESSYAYFAFSKPLAHIGKAAIHLNQCFLQSGNNQVCEKFYLHGKRAIREIVKLRKRERLGELTSLILLLLALDTLNLDVCIKGDEISPEFVAAFKLIITKDIETIHVLEQITSPYYLRRIVLTTALKILAKRNADTDQKLRARGLTLLGNFIPRMMARGEFSWDILANLWRFEKGHVPSTKKNVASLHAVRAILKEGEWNRDDWRPWVSKWLLQHLARLQLKQSRF